jgi:hypothetical protein
MLVEVIAHIELAGVGIEDADLDHRTIPSASHAPCCG